MLDVLIEQAFEILDRGRAAARPHRVVCLFSGGYDSMVATHIAMRWAIERNIWRIQVASIDTMVSADGWRDFVTGVASSQKWTHHIWDNPNPDWYLEDAKVNGFPYTRAMHSRIIYRMLKERAIDKMRADLKQYRTDRLMMVAGIRRAESAARAGTSEQQRDGLAWWVNPLVNWPDEAVAQYRVEHSLPVNPFYETVGGSGDCQCNWGQFTDIDNLRRYSPRLAAQIMPVHEYCIRVHGYGWGERPDRGTKASMEAEAAPDVDFSLCEGCQRAKPDASRAAEWRTLQEGW